MALLVRQRAPENSKASYRLFWVMGFMCSAMPISVSLYQNKVLKQCHDDHMTEVEKKYSVQVDSQTIDTILHFYGPSRKPE
jgi:hypothetical protein